MDAAHCYPFSRVSPWAPWCLGWWSGAPIRGYPFAIKPTSRPISNNNNNSGPRLHLGSVVRCCSIISLPLGRVGVAEGVHKGGCIAHYPLNSLCENEFMKGK